MTCQYCAHWHAPQWEAWKTEEAPCTLNPVWVKTRREHFCGQHTPVSTHIDYASALKERRESEKYAAIQKERALHAEKAAKKLRAQIKALKAKP